TRRLGALLRWRTECILPLGNTDASGKTGMEKEPRVMDDRKSNWKWNGLAIATVLAATAATASAQEIITLKGNIPFEFSINGRANLAPGNYVITRERNVWY